MAVRRSRIRPPFLLSLPMNSATTFDASTGVIDFSVIVAGKAIPCRVTEGWLRQAYGPAALDDGPLNAFAARRATVDAAAVKTWLASQGAEPVWLKHDQVWRQPQRSAATRPVEST
jgi:hypothetical protein